MKDWIKDNEWRGNPSLGYESYTKNFFGYTVTIFGNEGVTSLPCYDYREGDNGQYLVENRYIAKYQDFSNWSYVVKNCYSGGFPSNILTIEQAKDYLENKFLTKENIY